MVNLHDNYWVPSDGYTYLTNGEVYTDSIYLGKGQNISAWHDTNDEPPEPEELSLAAKAEAYDILMGVTP